MGGTTGDAATTGSPLSAASDQILVERAVDGDATAFGEIVRRHSSLMRAYVSRIVGSLSEADDVVQDAFITAWKQLPSLRDGSAVRAWLMRIASREAFARLRRRTADVPIEDVPLVQSAHPDPEVRAVRQAQIAALSAALDELPEDQRRAWLLREVADLSYAEIAEEMTTSASTVRGLLSRARSSIAIRMEDWR